MSLHHQGATRIRGLHYFHDTTLCYPHVPLSCTTRTAINGSQPLCSNKRALSLPPLRLYPHMSTPPVTPETKHYIRSTSIRVLPNPIHFLHEVVLSLSSLTPTHQGHNEFQPPLLEYAGPSPHLPDLRMPMPPAPRHTVADKRNASPLAPKNLKPQFFHGLALSFPRLPPHESTTQDHIGS